MVSIIRAWVTGSIQVEGDLHELVLKLEEIFHRVHQVQVSSVFKQAVISDIHAAVSYVEAAATPVVEPVKATTSKRAAGK